MNGLTDLINKLLDSFRIKEGYHSNQDCIFGTIKRSEFYGFAVGYALGTIYRGLFDVSDNMVPVILAALGFVIGVWYDRKYCIVPDDPVPEESGEEPESETPEGELTDVLPEDEPADPGKDS